VVMIRMCDELEPLLRYIQHAAVQIMPLLPAATARLGYEMSAVSLLGLATSLVSMTPPCMAACCVASILQTVLAMPS
jgi:hypothetical protein